jgi:colanic acid biosynthesis glycosyl transferase WcaI
MAALPSIAMDDEDMPAASEVVVLATKRRVIVYGMNFSPEIAGVGRYTGEIAEHLVAEGAEVTVVTTPPHYPGWRVQPGHANRYSQEWQAGMRIVRVPLILRQKMKGIWRLVAPLSFALSSAPIIVWEILRLRPQTVFCVEPTLFAAPAAQLAAKLVGSDVVLHVQDLEVDAAFAVGHLGSKAWLKKLGYAFERLTLRGFDRVITISNRMAEKLAEKGLPADKISVVRNWVDLSHIFPMREISPYRGELGFAEKDFVVLYSGNIGAKQGLNVLLQAAERLSSSAHIHFVVAGEGPAKAELQSRYAHLTNLRFLPFQPYKRLNEFLNMPDVHVLPQERDAADLVLPSKLGGMLASGKPILVTADRDTELAHVLGDAVAYAEPGDPSSLAEAILLASQVPSGSTDLRVELAGSLDKEKCLRTLILEAVRPVDRD